MLSMQLKSLNRIVRLTERLIHFTSGLVADLS